MSNARPVTYVAYTYVPGYLPSTAGIGFDTAAAAWAYLWDEHSRACFDVDQDVPLDASTQFADASHQRMTGALTLPTPGYTGDHDLGITYEVERYEGVICADCGARFAHTDEALVHWEHTH